VKKHILSVLGYIVATFAVQAISHFVVFAQHYSGISIIKPEPNFALGFTSMIIQGAVLSYIFARSRFNDGSMKGATIVAWLFGAFLVSYIALAEAGKYNVPSVASWIAVEALAGFTQYTLVGICLGLAHRRGA
jgi:hypothetical protein